MKVYVLIGLEIEVGAIEEEVIARQIVEELSPAHRASQRLTGGR